MKLKRETFEILTGAATLAVAIGVFVFSYGGAALQSAGSYDVIARFRNVDGIRVGSEVRLAGVKVGAVAAQYFDAEDLQAVLVIRLDQGIEVPTDSAAMIISQGILGGKFVRIEPGGEEAYFGPGDEFEYVQNSVILEDVLQRLIIEVEAARKRKKAK